MMDPKQPDDLNDRQTWQVLDAKLRPFVAGRVPARDVDDVVQEVFLRIQRGLSQLRDDQRFGPWVYRVARSAVVDHWRRSARHPLASGEPGEAALHRQQHTSEHLPEATEQEVANYAALLVDTLPAPYREALTLTELQGMSQRDAAARLGISVSGMKSRVQRGREKLRTALENCCHIALDARRRVIGCQPRGSGESFPDCCSPRSDATVGDDVGPAKQP